MLWTFLDLLYGDLNLWSSETWVSMVPLEIDLCNLTLKKKRKKQKLKTKKARELSKGLNLRVPVQEVKRSRLANWKGLKLWETCKMSRPACYNSMATVYFHIWKRRNSGRQLPSQTVSFPGQRIYCGIAPQLHMIQKTEHHPKLFWLHQ